MIKTYSLLAYHAKTLSNNLTSFTLKNSNISEQKTTSIQAIDHFIKQLDKTDLYLSQLNIQTLTKQLFNKIKQKSLLILIGDFLGDIDLSSLNKKHELFITIIRDSFEENPTILGEIEAKDPVTGKSSKFNFDKYAKDAYKKRYLENDKKLFKHLRSLKINYIKIATNEDAYKKLYL